MQAKHILILAVLILVVAAPVQAGLLQDIMNLLIGGDSEPKESLGTPDDFQNWSDYYLKTKPGLYVTPTCINYTLIDFDTTNFTYQIDVLDKNFKPTCIPATLTTKRESCIFNISTLPTEGSMYIRLIARNKDSLKHGGTNWCNKKINRSNWIYIEEIKEYQCPISKIIDIVLVEGVNTYPSKTQILDELKQATVYKNESIPGASWAARWKMEEL